MSAPAVLIPRLEIDVIDKNGKMDRNWYKYLALLGKSVGPSTSSNDDVQIRDILSAFSTPPPTQQQIGLQFYPRTDAERALGIGPSNYAYPAYDVRRYGAVGNGVTADDLAIQTAIDAAQQAGTAVYLTPGAQHFLASGVAFKQGRSASDPKSYFVWLEGRFATLRPSTGITAITITPRCLLADVGTGRAVAPIFISDVTVDGGSAAAGSANALLIGAAGLQWDAFSWSCIRNFNVQNLTQAGQAVMLWEGRHCVFENMNLRSGASLYIQATTANSFVGDLTFQSCEFSGTAAQAPITIAAGGGATNSQARGIKFIGCDIYGGGSFIHATGSGQVGDIWFVSGCQFDQAAGTDIFMTIYNDSATAQLFDVHLVGGYFNVGTQAVYVHMVAGATMKQIEVGGNVVSGLNITSATGGAAIYGLNCNGLSIHDNVFDLTTGNGTTNSYINLDGVTNFMVNNNQATNATTMTYGVSYGNAITKYSIIGNLLNCTTVTNDYHSGSPVGQVANNLAV